MKLNVLKCVFSLAFLGAFVPAGAQKLITYEAGMGTRDPNDADTWILYQRVRAEHDGMVLYADSALLNQVRNDLTAFGNVKIVITDTTTIYGDQLFYDGEARVLDIWDDTVRFIDGKTLLKSDHLIYNRFTAIAAYDTWGVTVNQDKRLISNVGYYNSETKVFDIYRDVVLSDSNMRLETDTLKYSVDAHLAEFWSPTHVYTDSTTIYSERGIYNTDLRYAHSVKSSEVHNKEKHLTCDTLHYYEKTEFGMAIGHVVLTDTANDIVSTSRYAETRQEMRTSLITDSALVRLVSRDEDDSLSASDTVYIHADSIVVANDSSRKFSSLKAYRHVKAFRSDAQAMCDSAFYSASDSLLRMFQNPVLWYGHYQCTADTISVLHDSSGSPKAYLNNNVFCVEQLDEEKFNQVKGRDAVVYFKDKAPDYADILGNAEMVYYITDEEANGLKSLIGVNVGVGSSMRIYFKDRAPDRMAIFGKPDMNTYPLEGLEVEKRRLPNFQWYEEQRPKKPLDVFKW